MSHVVVVRGSPQLASRSSWVAQEVTAGLPDVRFVAPTDLKAEEVLLARRSPDVDRFVVDVRGARALVVATPVYKATYAGALKALIDLIPEDALRDKAVLGIATTKSAEHAVPVAAALDALFAFFHARPVAHALVLRDDELLREGERFAPSVAARARIHATRAALVAALTQPTFPSTLPT